MNPQQQSVPNANDPALQARLTQLPPARPVAAGVQVPGRQPIVLPPPTQPTPLAGPPPRPATPMPARPVMAPAPVVGQPVVVPPRPLVMPPAPPVVVPPMPVAVAAAPPPTPVPTPPPTPPPAPAPQSPPPANPSVIPPMPAGIVVVNDVTPAPLVPLEQPIVPKATDAKPASNVSYQPQATAQNNMAEITERIDETPQQNSSDIEGLIAHQHRLKRLKSIASTLLFIAGVAAAAFLINSFVFQSYYVDGTSMTPTLQNDDRLIIDKVEHTWASLQGHGYIPQRGQIIVLDSSIVGVGGRNEQLIKRVIGLPGDTVIVQDSVVTIKNKDHPDGFDVDKSLGLNLAPTFVAAPINITLTENQVFVMGDNRVENGSYDSRAFGPIDSSKIVGRLWARILPVDKAKIF